MEATGVLKEGAVVMGEDKASIITDFKGGLALCASAILHS